MTYSSSDPDTAGVSSTGLVTATATANQGQDRQDVVTIEAENGIKTTVDVTVKIPIILFIGTLKCFLVFPNATRDDTGGTITI